MRYLLFHADYIRYRTLRKALKHPPDPPGEYEAGPAVVVFLTVERGDDDWVVEEATRDILDYSSNKVREQSILLYPYAHLSSDLEKPGRAHKILVRLEERIRREWQGSLHRAPFGWYKEFEIKVKGHPLAELSRTIRPRPPLLECGGQKARSLSEALAMGCLPGEIASPVPMEGLAGEKLGLLGLRGCGGWEAWEVQRRLVSAVQRLAGRPVEGVVGLMEWADRVEAGLRWLRQVLTGGLTLGLHSCPLNTTIGLQAEILQDLLDILGLTEHLSKHTLDTATLYYYAHNGNANPIALQSDDKAAVGPLYSILYTIIHIEAQKASKGETPQLPPWLHPITAAIIPARDAQQGYAEELANSLSKRGATVALLQPTVGVGARIRWAGKRWIPYVIVVGEREEKTGRATVRRRWKTGEQESISIVDLVEEVSAMVGHYSPPGTVHRMRIG
ncbi:MAG: hypothetical protein F7C35_05125 [Desulfurococcales archaeon]|nr:hypothetical protein [Desulfurococcales archaeon]